MHHSAIPGTSSHTPIAWHSPEVVGETVGEVLAGEVLVGEVLSGGMVDGPGVGSPSKASFTAFING